PHLCISSPPSTTHTSTLSLHELFRSVFPDETFFDTDNLTIQFPAVRTAVAANIDPTQIHHAGSRKSHPSDRTTNLHRLVHSDFSDRKSTRLNSSHVKISYAVFCLKKK